MYDENALLGDFVRRSLYYEIHTSGQKKNEKISLRMLGFSHQSYDDKNFDKNL